jgi:uncharacterized protein YbjT (DUF2867 family)
MGIRVIITGTTGMVGEGVLLECLGDSRVEAVLVINRKPIGRSNPKLTEIIHSDFYDLSAIETQLTGYNACFFCLGISSVGISAEQYYKVTYTLTMGVAATLSRLNTGMTFCYVSGGGTDRTEKGRSRWARVKGKTENDLMKLPFRRVYAFRPGFLKPVAEQQRVHAFYRYINWLYPLGRALYPDGFNTLREVALAMIQLAAGGYPAGGYATGIITGKDMIQLAQ